MWASTFFFHSFLPFMISNGIALFWLCMSYVQTGQNMLRVLSYFFPETGAVCLWGLNVSWVKKIFSGINEGGYKIFFPKRGTKF